MKRIFVPVKAQSKMYKLFVDDLTKIYKVKKGSLPRLPKYTDESSPQETKDEVDTQIDFNMDEEVNN